MIDKLLLAVGYCGLITATGFMFGIGFCTIWRLFKCNPIMIFIGEEAKK